MKILNVFLAAVIVIANLSLAHAEFRVLQEDEIKAVRVLNHANPPKRILVELTYGNADVVKEIIQTVASINRTERLQGPNQIEIVPVGQNGSYAPILGDMRLDDYQLSLIDPISLTADRWLQDFGEIMQARIEGDSQDQLLIFDTNRGRDLAILAEHLPYLWKEYFFKSPEYRPDELGDFGGNIEATPNDVLYIGDNTSSWLKDFFGKRGYRSRMEILETKWLNVGHVDEYVSTVPLRNDPCGFALVKADPRLGVELLKKTPRSELEKLGAFGHSTFSGDAVTQEQAGTVIDRNVLRLRKKIAAVTPACARMRELRFPVLFQCKPGLKECKSWLPDSVNMIVLGNHQIIPDPLLPTFRNWVAKQLQEAGQIPHFVNNVTYYHDHGGELHCGTQVVRIPNRTLQGTWWR